MLLGEAFDALFDVTRIVASSTYEMHNETVCATVSCFTYTVAIPLRCRDTRSSCSSFKSSWTGSAPEGCTVRAFHCEPPEVGETSVPIGAKISAFR